MYFYCHFMTGSKLRFIKEKVTGKFIWCPRLLAMPCILIPSEFAKYKRELMSHKKNQHSTICIVSFTEQCIHIYILIFISYHTMAAILQPFAIAYGIVQAFMSWLLRCRRIVCQVADSDLGNVQVVIKFT